MSNRLFSTVCPVIRAAPSRRRRRRAELIGWVLALVLAPVAAAMIVTLAARCAPVTNSEFGIRNSEMNQGRAAR
jgi:hypothetical protein